MNNTDLCEIHELCDHVENKYVLSVENMAASMHILGKLNVNGDDVIQFLLDHGIEIKQNEKAEQNDKDVNSYMGIIDICTYDENEEVCLKYNDLESYILEKNANRDKLLQFINKMKINIIQ
jgi:hypothetical protein